jgi:LPXTG-site transpeptidase (sortase) family protein
LTRTALPAKQRQRRLYLAALTLFLGTLGIVLVTAAIWHEASSPTPTQTLRALPLPHVSHTSLFAPQPRPLPNWRSAPRPAPRQLPRPLRIDIAAIGVSAPVIPLGLDRNKTLQVPSDYSQTGWFVGGPEPGEIGAAVIVGHVDSKSGPGVFYQLRALRRGDIVRVTLKGGTAIRFAVTSTRAVPKNHFPTRLVYAETKYPALRLITCGGAFDRASGHYVDNHIVFAVAVSDR